MIEQIVVPPSISPTVSQCRNLLHRDFTHSQIAVASIICKLKAKWRRHFVWRHIIFTHPCQDPHDKKIVCCSVAAPFIYILSTNILDKILRYDLYYFLTYLFKWRSFNLETCTTSYYPVLNFYQINKDGETRTRDHFVIKILISY
jgi:hypothetical protein